MNEINELNKEGPSDNFILTQNEQNLPRPSVFNEPKKKKI